MNSIETSICRRLVAAALKSGYRISVYDGEEFPLRRSTDRAAILAAMFSTDSDTLVLRRDNDFRVGSIVLVYGNGEDVICDYSDNEATRALVDSIL